MTKKKHVIKRIFAAIGRGLLRGAKAVYRVLPAILTTLAVWASFFALSIFVLLLTDSAEDFHPMNLLFSGCWSAVFTAVLLTLPRTARRIAYATLYTVLLVYGFAQYVYYGFFGKLISFSSFANLGEGADYVGAITEKIGVIEALMLLVMLVVGVFVTALIHMTPYAGRILKRGCTLLGAVSTLLIIALLLPLGLGTPRKSFTWTPGDDERYVYDNFLDRQACLGMAGYYQYLALDGFNCFIKPLFSDSEEQREAVDTFFAEHKSPHKSNSMTAALAGKNVVFVMLESMDYLALGDEENTPTIHMMMEKGINFTNYYAPLYGDGATFSNEFTLNTGIITPTDGKTLYNYQNNTYSKSLAALFKNAGYRVNSYHENHGSFYNREDMHMSFGYEKYYSFYDYGGSAFDVAVDTYLTRTPALMDDFLGDGEAPFFNFLITYSAHLSYYYTEGLTSYAYDNYVEEDELRHGAEDLNCLRAKARITDRMLAELIEACPEDTVFICATDHYCYGLSDRTKEKELGEDENLRQRVPFFIYSKSEDIEPMQVDKLCANVDFFPTVANLMGLGVPEYSLGNDIFDEGFEGYVIFSDFALLTEDVYYKDGEADVPLTEEDTARINSLLTYAYARAAASNSILSSNYYKD